MNAYKRSVIIDIDGTLYDDFSQDDRRIISKIFEDNAFVKLLDKFLWAINSLDFFTNSMGMLNLRLWIYSILSFKNFDKIKLEYGVRYQNLLRLNLQRKKNILKEINKRYNIVLVTNNMYATRILCEKLNYDVIYAPNVKSRRKQIKEKNYYQSISYIFGNNYTDDVFMAKKMNVTSIYVGNSIIKKSFNANFNVLSFNEALKIIKDGS